MLTTKSKSRKKAVNITLDEDILQEAKSLKINLSQTLEETLAELIKNENRRRWLEENREAIEDYNKRITHNGTFSDGLRRF